jgi:hypothetical protein
MLRALLLALGLAALAPTTAAADCVVTCGDICYAPPGTAFYRAEVLTVEYGYAQRVRLVEHLAGGNTGAVGDEREDVYAEQTVVAGDFLFVSIAPYTDGTPGDYVWNIARRIDSDQIECSVEGRSVDIDQYAAMAASPSCPDIRRQLELESPPCDDTADFGGCNAGGAASFGVSAALLMLRRRRRV